MQSPGEPLIFVYGTLKPGGAHWPEYCAGRVLAAMPAKVRGRVYDLPGAGYPAARFDEDGWIHGFVLAFADPEDLASIDRLEGYNPQGPGTENEYARLRVHCHDPADRPFGDAWSYQMSRERIAAMGGRVVDGGDWTPAR